MINIFFVGNCLYLPLDNFGDDIQQERKYIWSSIHGGVNPLKIYTENELILAHGNSLKSAKDLKEYIELYNKH